MADPTSKLRPRTPRILFVFLILAIMIKVVLFATPYFNQRIYPPAFEHEDGTGFAVEQQPAGDYVYVEEPHMTTSVADSKASSPASNPGASISATPSSSPPSTVTSQPDTASTINPVSATQSIYQTFRTTPFVAPVLNITQAGETAPGLLFLGPRGNGTKSQAPLIMSQTGELIWHGPLGTTTNMKLQTYKGEPHITFWNGTSVFTFGHGYGAVHVLNSSYQEVAKVSPEGLDLVTELEDKEIDDYLDMHESYIIPRDTLVVTAYNVTRLDLTPINGSQDAWVFDSLFYEIDITTQEVLFRWRASDHLDQIPLNLTKYPLEKDGEEQGTTRSEPFDFFHINSVQPLEDGGWLVNSRHMWSVLKLNASGSVDWRFRGDDGGDFLLGLLGKDIGFAWQHHARAHNVTNSTMRLTLFDNGNSEVSQGDSKASRGMEIFLDWEKGDSLLLRTWEDDEDPRYSYAMGSVQSLPGGAKLVGYGKDPTFKEFNRTESLVYSATFGRPEGDDVVASYRVYKFEWSAVPDADPEIVAEYDEEKDETRIWASWNGATPDVFDEWRVSVGDDDRMEDVDEAFPRTGFESSTTVHGRHQQCRATAMQEGKPVRSSRQISVADAG